MRQIPCKTVFAYVMQEQRRMVREAADQQCEGAKARTRSAAKNLGVPFEIAWRARQGRLGVRTFPPFSAAYDRWKAKGETQAAEVLARLDAIEKTIADILAKDSNSRRRQARASGLVCDTG